MGWGGPVRKKSQLSICLCPNVQWATLFEDLCLALVLLPKQCFQPALFLF